GAVEQLSAAVRRETLEDMEGPARHDRASLFMVRVRKGADPDRVREWIETYIPTVSAISVATAIAQVDQRLSYFRQLAVILGSVSLLVGFLLVTTLVTVSVNERAGEIAVMRAITETVTTRYLNGILATFPGLPMAIDFFLFQPVASWSALGLLAASGV